MQELIKISEHDFKGEKIPAIDARELWIKLESKQEFASWIKKRIEEAKLVEGQDYVSFDKIIKRESGATTRKEHMLSLDSGKHIAMMEGGNVGYQIRQYFIDFEKKAKQQILTMMQGNSTNLLPTTKAQIIISDILKIGELLESPKHLSQIEAVKMAKEMTSVDVSHLLSTSKAMDKIKEEEIFLEVSAIAERLGIEGSTIQRGKKINDFLAYIGWQYKTNDGWNPTQEGKEHSFQHAWKVGSKSGYNFKWKLESVLEKWNSEITT